MAIPRKDALKRLGSLLPEIDKHIQALTSEPKNTAVAHWKHECRNWLIQIEEMLPHVGKKTSAKWRAIVEDRKAKLEQ
jgi:hypothetical protein